MNRTRQPQSTLWHTGLALLAGTLVALGPALASPPRGSEAPRIMLTDLEKANFDSAQYKGRTLVLIFGELSHEKLAQACADTDEALHDPRLPKDAAVPVLVVAHEPSAEALTKAREGGHLPRLIVNDPRREAFGAYQIVVVPMVIIVGPDGKVIYAMPSFSPNFKEVLTEATLLGAGKIDAAQFDQTLAHPANAAVSGPEARGSRLTHLARELARRGMPELAEQRYREAIQSAPKDAEAHLGLGALLLDQDRLADADASFRTALELTPGSNDANLGLDAVAIRRGGEGLAKAETDLRRIIAANPKMPRAHYLLGLVHQQRSEHAEAAVCFRKAFELLQEHGENP